MELFENPIANAFAIMSLFVAGLALLLFYLKKIAEKQRVYKNEVDLRIVSRQPVTQKSQIVIIETEGKRMMVGVTEANINLIAELENNISPAVSDALEPAVPKQGFASLFKDNLAKQIKTAVGK